MTSGTCIRGSLTFWIENSKAKRASSKINLTSLDAGSAETLKTSRNVDPIPRSSLSFATRTTRQRRGRAG